MHQKISCLYWLGAGTASCPEIEFDDYGKVVLVDARTEACNRLGSLASAHQNLCVINACIGIGGEETSQFNIYNEHSLSAKGKPTTLLELFPGLKLEESVSVKALSVSEVLNEVHPENNNILILDLLDSCGSVLLELKETGLLHFFEQLFISCGVDSLFEGAWEKNQVVEFLFDEFFNVESVNDADPDIQLIEFKLDRKGKSLKESKQENQNLKKEVEYLRSEVARKDGLLIEHNAAFSQAQEKHVKDLEHLKSEIAQKDGLLLERDAAFTEAQEKHAKDLEHLKSELGKKDGLLTERDAAFTEAREKHAKDLEHLKSEVAQKDGLLIERDAAFTEAQEKHANEVEHLKSEIAQKDSLLIERDAALNEAQEKHVKESEQLKSEIAKVHAEHERSTNSMSSTLEKLDDEKAKLLRQKQEFLKQVAQQTASISILGKQNLKLQVDLDDLRHKFDEKVASEDALKSLIGELHQKLQQAANFYQKLEKEHPELLGRKSE
ncbi:hypothetical protein [Alteromonas macleodii]|uniref:Uncharacterized protein n=1 Tax=Alteromonas macleodii TaxID=28108 RepID=A0A6T9Y754_ALTMA|nr:hypothetical protein [Alteromonas macleodii]CAB9495513.1 protein of unknown function [Alteromonas macleodii]